MTDQNAAPAPEPQKPSTAAYFAATADGPFDHQRDAYEQGWDDGGAAERKAVRQLIEDAAMHELSSGSRLAYYALRRLAERLETTDGS